MALLQLRYLGDPILRKKAKPLEEVSEEILKLIEDMTETMYFNEGVGLAAPQIGVSQRVIVFDNVQAGYGNDPQALINPEIVSGEGSVKAEEGCLCIPEVRDMVERKEKVVIKALNKEGREVKIEAEGLPARILQHEIDHLEGILFIDRLGALKKKLALSRWKKSRRELEARDIA